MYVLCIDNLVDLSNLVCVCVSWYLQYQEEKRRGRKRKDDSEMKDENIPPHIEQKRRDGRSSLNLSKIKAMI